MAKFWVWHNRGPAVEMEAESVPDAVEKYAKTYGYSGRTFIALAEDVASYEVQLVVHPVARPGGGLERL